MIEKKYIITGPPGAGKTTLINQLRNEGFSVISEASRDVIKQEQLKKTNAVPWQNVEAFSLLAFKEIKNRLENNPKAIFSDRGLIDVIAYLEFYNKPVFPELLNFPFSKHYHKTVFFAPSWQAIYQTDEQRPQQYAELQGLSEKIKEVHERLGFQCIFLDKVSVSDRLKFIEANILRLSK